MFKYFYTQKTMTYEKLRTDLVPSSYRVNILRMLS